MLTLVLVANLNMMLVLKMLARMELLALTMEVLITNVFAHLDTLERTVKRTSMIVDQALVHLQPPALI